MVARYACEGSRGLGIGLVESTVRKREDGSEGGGTGNVGETEDSTISHVFRRALS